ncbi:unnamed protein product, partial [marine sediment metagenome]
MIRVTRWSPDTCGCILEYEWDDAQDENTRTHSFKKAVKLCEHHKALAASGAYNQVMSENTRKNQVWGFIEDMKSKAGEKDSIVAVAIEDYTWSFDATRKLKVGFLGKLKAGEKSSLQTLCDSKF